MTTEEKAAPKPKELTMTDWQEAYFDLLNKVECDCVQQGDLVPIWDQFKRMNLTITKLQGHQAALEAELAAMKARGDRLANYAAHAENCGAADIGRCTCGMAQALTEWRDQ